ncbi:hypothetical protein E2C01_031132 [Portunus trituberculatus]|uniref:Uncharacterized protein n=1 Tax=Portunus trituberculatus TaxID=210409 RepID=A0A5B7EW27_PORTR|nr:hypothetical protein [Portunus trituberculatus]
MARTDMYYIENPMRGEAPRQSRSHRKRRRTRRPWRLSLPDKFDAGGDMRRLEVLSPEVALYADQHAVCTGRQNLQYTYMQTKVVLVSAPVNDLVTRKSS